MSSNRFTEDIFIITGAASGIGRELSLQAAQKGAQVIATDQNRAGLAETVALGLQNNLTIQSTLLDVSDSVAIRQFAQNTIPVLKGRRLVLVNNAGVGLQSGNFSSTDLEDFEWLMNINLWGAIRLTKAFYPYFLAQGKGHIVNLSSVFGLIGVAMNVPYCTSKFALRGFTESLRMELHGTGIHITAVHPGGIKTNIVRNALVRGDARALAHQKSINSFEKRARTTAKGAASQILQAIEKKKSRLVIGSDGKVIDFLARLLPVGYTSIIEKRLRKTFGEE